MLTDPQNDAKCRDCGALTQHASERCDDCRTPAGRLAAELATRGVRAKAGSRCDVSVDILAITVDEEEWTISSVEATHAETVEAAATAIAAIVQAPGLRAERDALAAENARLRAHNARMAAQINALADACEREESALPGSFPICDALPPGHWPETAAALRALAAGEVDDV